MDLQGGRPFVGLLPGPVFFRKKSPKPITLFLNAHFRNRLLDRVYALPDLGRVFEMSFGESHSLLIHLLPKFPNLIAFAGEKKISMHPVRDLPAHQGQASGLEVRSDFNDLSEAWFQQTFRKQAGRAAPDDGEKQSKAVAKKKLALEKITESLKELEAEDWSGLGELLKISQHLDVDHPLAEKVDREQSLAENIQMIFDKSKNQKRKLQGAHERMGILRKEIEALEKGPAPQVARASVTELMKKAKAQGRKLVLNEHLEAVCGKSAADNLALLRHAQKWDLWLHLKDYPSSHVIVRRPRDFKVSQEALTKVMQWFVGETLSSKNLKAGDKLEFIVTECRFVKPIKGDKLGRVNYSNESRLVLGL